MSLIGPQREIVDWLKEHSRYELRRGSDGQCFMYDLELFCLFDWIIWRKTVDSLLKKGVIEAFGQGTITGETRFRLTVRGRE